ncbi:MAG: DUF2920 family protein [Methylococcaceae bacterium]|nr:DUF2920 family protein [Methylococcaceae bacterium]
MATNPQEISFTSNPDFELRFNKNRPCKYQIHNPEFKAGLVVYIPGFGGDLGEYTEVFCRKVSSKYQLATLCVEYFCINSRPEVGAEIEFEESDLKKIKVYFPDANAVEPIKAIIEFAEKNNTHLNITASLKPKRGEYQNFGLLAALDILNAIKDAVTKYDINANNIILIGTSYGGYLANLVTKLFPGYIRAVFDNSSWAYPSLTYLVGREINSTEHYAKISAHVTLCFFVKSPWTLSTGLPHSFDDAKFSIRSFSSEQVGQMAAQGGVNTFYFVYHSSRDNTAPTQDKIEMIEAMQASGFKNLQLYVADESDVDGVFIKSLAHGMDMSMLTFFDKAYKALTELNINFIANPAKVFSYPLENCTYFFDVSQSPVAASVEYYT